MKNGSYKQAIKSNKLSGPSHGISDIKNSANKTYSRGYICIEIDAYRSEQMDSGKRYKVPVQCNSKEKRVSLRKIRIITRVFGF